MNSGFHISNTKSSPHFLKFYNSTKSWSNATDIFADETFDAEKLLEDLGFAGSTDPMIPERFVPSLLHRLSTMPRTALWYMNHRILQALILHKRKEQRRKLFRHASVNEKEVLESRSHVLNLLLNHTSESNTAKENGLVRALTGPNDSSEEIVISACQSMGKPLTSPLHSSTVITANIPETSQDCPIKIYIEGPNEEAEKENINSENTTAMQNAVNDDINNIAEDIIKIDTKLENENNVICKETTHNIIEKNVNISQVVNKIKRTISDKIPDRQETIYEKVKSCKNENIKSYSEENYSFPEMDNSRTTLTRSFSKFSRDQRRMVLKRSSAILRPRSSSEPVLIMYPVKFDGFDQDNDNLIIQEHTDLLDTQNKIKTTDVKNNSSHISIAHENMTFSLISSSIPLLRFSESYFQNICSYIKYWSPVKLKTLVTEDSLINYGFNDFVTCCHSLRNMSQQDLPVSISASSLHFQFTKSLIKIKSVLDFMQMKGILLNFTNETHLPNNLLQRRIIMRNSNYLESDSISKVFETNSKNSYSDNIHTDKKENDNQFPKETIFLLSKNFFNHCGNGKKTNSNYLSVYDKDKIHKHQVHNHDNSPMFTRYNSSSLSIAPTMNNHNNDECCSKFRYISGIRIDIGHNKPGKTYFRTGLRIKLEKSPNNLESKKNAETSLVNLQLKEKSLPAHNFFQQASQNLAELQEYIQKAKTTRQSAFSELQHLQCILLEQPSMTINSKASEISNLVQSINNQEDKSSAKPELKQNVREFLEEQDHRFGEASAIESNEISRNQSEMQKKINVQKLRKNLIRAEQKHSEDIIRIEKELQITKIESQEVKRSYENKIDNLHQTVSHLQKDMNNLQKALAELQTQAKAQTESTSAHIEKEIRSRIQREVEQEWKERMIKVENKLEGAERQIKILNKENEQLRHQILHSQLNSTNCLHDVNGDIKSSSVLNGFVANGYINCHEMTEKKLKNEKKLRDELQESEERADHLNLLLDEKLVELNKLQLAFSKRTKEMVLLERAYLQLVCHLYKNQHNSSRNSNPLSSLVEDSKSVEDPP